MKKDLAVSKISDGLIADMLQILQTARKRAYTAVNHEMVQAYWLMGKRIVQEEQQGEQKATYGEAILKTLSIALTSEFGKGFSYANLRNFRQFYLTYSDVENCYALRSNLTWTHHRLIMRVENPNTRDYYLREYALQDVHKPTGVSEFTLDELLPPDLKSNLPTIEEFEQQLKKLEDAE